MLANWAVAVCFMLYTHLSFFCRKGLPRCCHCVKREKRCVFVCLYIFQIQIMCVFGVGEFGGSGVSPIQLCAIDVHGRL